MNAAVPVPDYRAFALPAPTWLLLGLLIFVFWLHIMLAGTVLGGSVFVLLRRLLPWRRSELDRQLDARLMRALPVFISLTITLGVAPLLFVQVLYGHYFYTANIFIANFWMLSLGLLLLGFVSVYLAGRHERAGGVWWFVLLAPLCFVGIAYIFTNNAVLTIQPEYWLAFHRGLSRLHVKDAALLPRLLHNLGAALVFSGLAIAWVGRHRSMSEDVAATERAVLATRSGLRWLLWGVLLQIPLGVWFLLSLPATVQKGLVGFNNVTSMAWWAAVALAGLTVVTALNGIMQPGRVRWLVLSTLLPMVGVVGMLLARQYLRSEMLARESAGGFDIFRNWQTEVQLSPILTFAVTLVIGLGVLAWLLAVVLRSRGKSQADSAQ
jgi:hypothetical protein